MTPEEQSKFIEELKRAVRERDSKIDKLEQELRLRDLKIQMLEAKMDKMLRRLFGKSSEQLDSGQLTLMLEGVPVPQKVISVEASLKDKAPRKKPAFKKVRPERLPEHLSVVEEVIDPLEVQSDPTQWRCIGQEVSEQLEFEPSKVYRRRMLRRKFVKKENERQAPLIAPLAPKLLEGSILSASMLSHVISNKFCYHLPLYRQETLFLNRYGLNLPRQTLARWLWTGAWWLGMIYREIRAEVWKKGYVQIDETPIEYLSPGNGKTKTGYLWTCCDPGGEVVYQWYPSRASECLKGIVNEDFDGWLQTDGYSAYQAYGKDHPDIQWAGCWAHARRGFYESQDQDKRRSAWVLGQIQQLYAVEAKLRIDGGGKRRREATRIAESLPVILRMEKVFDLWKNKQVFLPQSGLGKAIHYASKHWKQLKAFISHGMLEIDNNLVENSIRPTAVGKKNWLFFGSECSGETGATLFTIIESCRRNQIDPEHYLRYVLERLPSTTNHQAKNLTPSVLAKTKILPRVDRPSRRWNDLEPVAA